MPMDWPRWAVHVGLLADGVALCVCSFICKRTLRHSSRRQFTWNGRQRQQEEQHGHHDHESELNQQEEDKKQEAAGKSGLGRCVWVRPGLWLSSRPWFVLRAVSLVDLQEQPGALELILTWVRIHTRGAGSLCLCCGFSAW